MKALKHRFKPNKSLVAFFVLALLMVITIKGRAQFVQIESILVDACDGTVEGKNEMVSFVVESISINVADIRVDGSINGGGFQSSKWPNTSNSFLGWIVPGTAAYTDAANKVAQINASIVNCGKLIMPTGGTNNLGLIPAGKKGLIITSTDFSPFANDFSTLTDTLYVIFQKPGNTSGHFANYSAGSGQRALRLHKISTNVNEDVSYDKSLLIDQSGNHIAEDGAGVRFTTSGVATYYNEGCQAPYIPLNPDWLTPGTLCPTSPSVNLNTMIDGTPNGTWSGIGVSGSVFNPSGLNGTYTITYTVGIPPCQVSQSHDIIVIPSAYANWTPPSALCQSSASVNLNSLLNANSTSGGVWSGSGVSGSTFNPSGLNGNVNITYSVGSNPCVATETHVIQVVSSVNSSWIPPSPICQSASPIDLNAFLGVTSTTGGVWSGNGVSGHFFNPSGLSGSISVTYSVGAPPCNSSETHLIQILNSANASWNVPNTVCQSSSPINLNALLTPSSTTGGVWSGNGVNGSTFNPNGLNGNINITYTVGNSPCIAVETHAISVIENANASWVTPNPLCQSSSSINLNALLTSTATTGGTWSGIGIAGNLFNPSGLSGNISITYSVGTIPCNDSQTHDIQILPSYNASWNAPALICQNAGAIDLSVLVTGDTGGLWFGQGVSQSQFNPDGLSGSILVGYVVSGTDACTDTVIHFINVISLPDATWISPDVICKKDNLFDLNSLITGDVGGTWSGNNVNSNYLDYNLVGDSLFLTYTVDDNGCVSSKTQMVYFSYVSADFTISPNIGFAPLESFTTNMSANAVAYSWNFGNGLFSNEVNPSVIYNTDGTFYVWLKATSSLGCIDSVFQVVIINETEDFIPNAITINRDGTNEEFYPVIMKNVEDYKMMIFNRWGEMIFNTTSQFGRWDGTYQGKKVAQGVYYYSITYHHNQKNKYYHGTITVID